MRSSFGRDVCVWELVSACKTASFTRKKSKKMQKAEQEAKEAQKAKMADLSKRTGRGQKKLTVGEGEDVDEVDLPRLETILEEEEESGVVFKGQTANVSVFRKGHDLIPHWLPTFCGQIRPSASLNNDPHAIAYML